MKGVRVASVGWSSSVLFVVTFYGPNITVAPGLEGLHGDGSIWTPETAISILLGRTGLYGSRPTWPSTQLVYQFVFRPPIEACELRGSKLYNCSTSGFLSRLGSLPACFNLDKPSLRPNSRYQWMGASAFQWIPSSINELRSIWLRGATIFLGSIVWDSSVRGSKLSSAKLCA